MPHTRFKPMTWDLKAAFWTVGNKEYTETEYYDSYHSQHISTFLKEMGKFNQILWDYFLTDHLSLPISKILVKEIMPSVLYCNYGSDRLNTI